jgi:hypothetical protein
VGGGRHYGITNSSSTLGSSYLPRFPLLEILDLCLGFCFIGGARLDGFDVSFRTRTSSHTRRCHRGNVIP